MNKAIDDLDDLYSVFFDNDVIKEKYGITEESAKEKYENIRKAIKAFSILKECLSCQYRVYEEDGKHYLRLYFDEYHQLTFNLKEGEYELLKEELE